MKETTQHFFHLRLNKTAVNNTVLLILSKQQKTTHGNNVVTLKMVFCH